MRLLNSIFILAGKLLSHWISPSGYFFFFPVAGMGGAEKVHLHILKTLPIKKSLIVFEKAYKPDWLHRFKKYGRTWFADFYLSYKRFHNIRRQIFFAVIVGAIKGHKNPKIFLGNFVSYHQVIGPLNNKVWIADIIHSYLDGHIPELLRLDIVPRLKKRYLISEHLLSETTEYYKSRDLMGYSDRLHVIHNFVHIPSQIEFDTFNKEKNVVYLGREAEEKRIHLAGEIGRQLKQIDSGVNIIFIGPSPHSIPENCREYIDFKGPIHEMSEIKRILQSASILLFTSRHEGVPLAMMEGMAHGVIPVSTAVGGIELHIKNNENGYLINDVDDESIIFSSVEIILDIFNNPDKMMKLGKRAYEHAQQNFCKSNFDNDLLDFFEIKI